MGMLVDGNWTTQWYDTESTGGHFERKPSSFRRWVTPDGAPGPTGEGGFPAEPGRYHLYVSLACPWASRAVIFRTLKRLEDVVSLSNVDPHMGEEGWSFGPEGDGLYGKQRLYEIYLLAQPDFTGRVTVPVLWDKTRRTIVNNESSEVIRMLNAAFDAFTPVKTDFYPAELRPEIDRINAVVYPKINNGVYRAGFATTQDAYEQAYEALFATLDDLEQRLGTQRYLAGDRVTEADWRLFTTLVRFDAVYFGHFKCNKRRIVDYPNLWDYTRELYQTPGVAETVSTDEIKRHYYGSHPMVNPTGIVPLGPEIDFSLPHTRGQPA